MVFRCGPGRTNVAAFSAWVMMAFAGLCGCGGGSSTSSAPTSNAVVVVLSPDTASVQTSQEASFTAVVANDPKNHGTTWTLSGAGCTGAACGTLSGTTAASGTAVMYTAPATVPNPPTVMLTATAVDDTTKSAKATITLTSGLKTSGISVVVAPSMASVAVGGTQTFAATLQNDSSNKGVNWSLSGSSCTGSACGTVSPASTTSGGSVTYTAPTAAPTGTITLTATSVTDESKSASASIALTTSVSTSVSVTPGNANIPTGGVTQTFTANVANDAQNLGVIWSISGTNCTGAACGSISPTTSASGAAVTYTSAASAASAGTVTVTATSVAEASAVGNAAVTLAAPQAPTVTNTFVFPHVGVDNAYGIPAIATDSAGNIDVAWINPDGVHFARSTDGGATFSMPVLIPSDLSKNLHDNLLSMVVDPLNNINLLWYNVLDFSDTSVGYNISRSMDNGATFSTPVQFTMGTQPITGGNVPIIVGFPDGKLVVTWIDSSSNVLAESTTDGTTFSAPATIATAVPNASNPIAVGSPDGHVYVLWTAAPDATHCSISFSASADATTYSAAKSISDGTGTCNSLPAASVDSNGNLDVTWVADAASLFFTRSTDGGATFSTPASVAMSANPTSNQLVAGPDGGIYSLWVSATIPQFVSSHDLGASFSSPPVALGIAVTGEPGFAVDACSNVTVLGANGATAYQRSNEGGATFSAPVTISQTHQDFEQQLAADKSGNVNFTWAVDGQEQVNFARLPTVCSIH
jgi:hypothetical protein